MSLLEVISAEKQGEQLRGAHEIVADVIRRRNAGEIITDEAVVDQHPEMARELIDLLQQAAMLNKLALRASGEKWAEAVRRMKADDTADADPIQVKPDSQDESGEESSHQANGQNAELAASAGIEVADSLSIGRGIGWLGSAAEATQAQRKTAEYSSLSNLRDSTSGSRAQRFRPTHRPPMALLEVLDDNQQDYELVRIRSGSFSIGREEGDLVIPHESQMSRRHAAIERRRQGDCYRWYLRDLDSTNGTYVRASRIALKHEDELLIGGVLIRFIQPAGLESASLAKVTPRGYEEQVKLRLSECWIGTDSDRCLSFLTSNPYLDPHHVRFAVGTDRRWRVFDEQSTNGVFARVKQIELRDGSEFHAGEQRFRIRLA
jgi:hypothetical protein